MNEQTANYIEHMGNHKKKSLNTDVESSKKRGIFANYILRKKKQTTKHWAIKLVRTPISNQIKKIRQLVNFYKRKKKNQKHIHPIDI